MAKARARKRPRPARHARRAARARKTAYTGMDRNFEHFIEELGEHGRRVREHGHGARDWWYSTFGPAGPLLGAAVGMIGVAVIAWVLSLVYVLFSVPFISMLSAFLFSSLPVFLFIFLVTNYLKHVYLSHQRLYYLVKPVKVAFEIAVAFWLLAWAMQFAGIQAGNVQLMGASLSIMGSLANIFFGFLVLAYLVALVKRERELYGSK